MDLHSALASLLRPMPAHALSSPFAPSLLALSQMDQQLLPLAQLAEQHLSPKKARVEDSSSPLSSSTVSSTQHSTSPVCSPRRKQPQPIPDEKKDIAYFERRRKNNDAAKRSRDLRRQKEEATSRRAAQLEQENAQLRGQLALMKSEMANIQLLLLSRVTGAASAVKSENISV